MGKSGERERCVSGGRLGERDLGVGRELMYEWGERVGEEWGEGVRAGREDVKEDLGGVRVGRERGCEIGEREGVRVGSREERGSESGKKGCGSGERVCV